MQPSSPKLLALGDSAWTLEFGSNIDRLVNARVMAVAARITQVREQEPLLGLITDVVPTFRSLTVHFSPEITDAQALGQCLLNLASDDAENSVSQGRHWRLPACFNSTFAPDLSALAKAKGIAVEQVIGHLLETQFHVYMIGFLPGFPYMGGLPKALSMPRLATPRQRVPAQSIAITGEMCAVYPWESPGGWHLVGRTPIQLFDLRNSHQPAMLAAGDSVTWYAIELDEYKALHEQCLRGQWHREMFLLSGMSV